jgi:hypothetical protein
VVVVEDPLFGGELEFSEGGVGFQAAELFFIDSVGSFCFAIDFTLT